MSTIVSELRKRVHHIHHTTGQRPTTLAITADEFRRLKAAAEPWLVERLSQPDGLSRLDGVILEVRDE